MRADGNSFAVDAEARATEAQRITAIAEAFSEAIIAGDSCAASAFAGGTAGNSFADCFISTGASAATLESDAIADICAHHLCLPALCSCLPALCLFACWENTCG